MHTNLLLYTCRQVTNVRQWSSVSSTPWFRFPSIWLHYIHPFLNPECGLIFIWSICNFLLLTIDITKQSLLCFFSGCINFTEKARETIIWRNFLLCYTTVMAIHVHPFLFYHIETKPKRPLSSSFQWSASWIFRYQHLIWQEIAAPLTELRLGCPITFAFSLMYLAAFLLNSPLH